MRPILAFLVLIAAGCSAYDVCGPSTCDGCCNAAGECELGSADLSCGTGGNQCQVCTGLPGPGVCKAHVCRGATVTPDGGESPDAGAPDAGGAADYVQITMVYTRRPESGCPVSAEPIECRIAMPVLSSRVAYLKGLYGGCQFFSDSTGRDLRFECLDPCDGYEPRSCVGADGGTFNNMIRVCNFRPYTVADFCAWQLP